jgi:hypothetical protein
MPGTLTEMAMRCRGPFIRNRFVSVGAHLELVAVTQNDSVAQVRGVPVTYCLLSRSRRSTRTVRLWQPSTRCWWWPAEPVPAPSDAKAERHGNVRPAYLFAKRFAL